MKKLTLQSIAALLVAVVISFSSCSKEGPEGPQGPQGAQGPQGTQGPEGDPGTANVIYSDWLDVTFQNGLAKIYAPDLTTDILNSGDIKVYWNPFTADDPLVVQVPCVVPISLLVDDPAEDDPDVFIDPYYLQDSIFLTSNYNLTSTGGSSQFRYILIPGGTAASGRKSSSSPVDWSDYAAVKKYLNLKD